MSDRLQSTEFEQWEEIAEAMDELQEAQKRLLDEIAQNGNVPKTVYRSVYSDLSEAQSQLKSNLDDRMFKEHPDRAEIDVFYRSPDG